MTRRFAAATTRNREPLLQALEGVFERFVPTGANVLEIASGTGEHATFFASRLDVSTWQPTDPDAESRASIDAWREHLATEAARVKPAIELDVTRLPWPVDEADAIVCINMIHISPWSACEALLDGASAILRAGGVLVLYGPYKRDGRHTSPSNEAFDEMLRGRDPSWGVRDLDVVTREAERRGLARVDVISMPANNLSVVFRKPPQADAKA